MPEAPRPIRLTEEWKEEEEEKSHLRVGEIKAWVGPGKGKEGKKATKQGGEKGIVGA